MTIDEAIQHAEEVAEEHAKYNRYGGFESCDECAKEHRQLAEWLKELKQLREQEPCEDVTHAPKKGKWIDTDVTLLNRQGYIVHEVICSECNGISYFRGIDGKYIGANLCPNCGAEMKGEDL